MSLLSPFLVFVLLVSLQSVGAFSLGALRVPTSTSSGTSTDWSVSLRLAAESEGESPSAQSESPENSDDSSEDPETTALKAEIADLEAKLANKKSTLAYAKEQLEEFSKTGYARAVAEMENKRRIRTGLQSSSRSSATAGILTDFLPAFDIMTALHEKYAQDDFGGRYDGLSMAYTFEKLGVQDYSLNPGDRVDQTRMSVRESEYSSEYAKDTVIRSLAAGMELDGNVIRAAQCAASLGEKEEGDIEASSTGSEDDREQ